MTTHDIKARLRPSLDAIIAAIPRPTPDDVTTHPVPPTAEEIQRHFERGRRAAWDAHFGGIIREAYYQGLTKGQAEVDAAQLCKAALTKDRTC